MKPLVSVCIVTYNSSQYVLETLESIKLQTYQNIELVVSDDCSTDDTYEVCQKWIKDNKERFVGVSIVHTPHNMGVAGNCNNAYEVANGEWIKGLAGDDKLSTNSIEEYVKYVSEHKECRICYAKASFFGNADRIEEVENYFEKNFYPYIKMDQKHQFKQILKTLFVPGPGLFMQKSLWKEVGRYDENYPFCEEYPFTYNVLAAGHRIHFIDKFLVEYRFGHNSLSNENGWLNYRTFSCEYRYFWDKRFNLMIRNGLFLLALHNSIRFYVHSLYYKKSGKWKYMIARNLYIFSPLAYIKIIVRLKNILIRVCS